MAAPSRHPLPPGPASRFLCQTKRYGRRGLGGGCGGAHPQGRPGRRKRDTGRKPLALGPREPLWGSALGRKGLHRPAGCPTGQDGAGAAAPAGPAHTHMACHTICGTHSPGSHRQLETCTHTRTRSTPAQWICSPHTNILAHTIAHVHTHQGSAAQSLVLAACVHSDTHRSKACLHPV